MCFKCGPKDHFIANRPKPETSDKKFHRNKENSKTRAYRPMQIYKTLENITNQIESQNIFASMEHMYSNAETLGRDFVDSSQPTNFILDSGGTCHMTPAI